MIRTSIGASLCFVLLMLTGCEQQRNQPGPKPISGAPGTSAGTPSAERPTGAPVIPGTTGASGAQGTQR